MSSQLTPEELRGLYSRLDAVREAQAVATEAEIESDDAELAASEATEAANAAGAKFEAALDKVAEAEADFKAFVENSFQPVQP